MVCVSLVYWHIYYDTGKRGIYGCFVGGNSLSELRTYSQIPEPFQQVQKDEI